MPRPLGLFPPTGRVSPAEIPPLPQFLARTVEKSRGRVEVRTLECTSLLTCFELWPGLKQGFRLTRTITRKGKTTTEVVHGITSLSEARADAAELLERVRGHWRVENQLHHVRDVTLGEDGCRVRSGNAPEALAGLRNVVVCLASQQLGDSHADVLRRLAARPEEALELLLKAPIPNSL
jgi:predicted transposase YbfD/YdcC